MKHIYKDNHNQKNLQKQISTYVSSPTPHTAYSAAASLSLLLYNCSRQEAVWLSCPGRHSVHHHQHQHQDRKVKVGKLPGLGCSKTLLISSSCRHWPRCGLAGDIWAKLRWREPWCMVSQSTVACTVRSVGNTLTLPPVHRCCVRYLVVSRYSVTSSNSITIL